MSDIQIALGFLIVSNLLTLAMLIRQRRTLDDLCRDIDALYREANP